MINEKLFETNNEPTIKNKYDNNMLISNGLNKKERENNLKLLAIAKEIEAKRNKAPRYLPMGMDGEAYQKLLEKEKAEKLSSLHHSSN